MLNCYYSLQKHNHEKEADSETETKQNHHYAPVETRTGKNRRRRTRYTEYLLPHTGNTLLHLPRVECAVLHDNN
jgi:hypothetical protein